METTPKGWETIARYCRRIAKAAAMNILLLLFALAATTPVVAATPTIVAIWSCDPCASLSDLQSAAQQTALKQQWSNYNNAIILMTSLNAPISAFFKLTVTFHTAWGTRIATYTATPITLTNMAAGTLDNSIFARATKFAPIHAPDLTYNEEDEIIVQYIETQLTETGGTGLSIWHGLTNFPQIVWYIMVDLQTGQSFQVYVGDTITIQYANGYSEQWQFLGPEAGSIQWKRVENTLMLKGKPVTPPSTKPAASIPGAGSLVGTDGVSPGTIQMLNDLNFCTGVTAVSVITDDGTDTSFGFYTFPC